MSLFSELMPYLIVHALYTSVSCQLYKNSSTMLFLFKLILAILGYMHFCMDFSFDI